jgi:hypothetical protein
MDGATLVVRGNTAAMTDGVSNSDPRWLPTGFIAIQGKNFHVHVVSGTVVTIDLTGTLNANGTLNGNGTSGGVHILNPDTGWSCDFAFVAFPEIAAGSIGSPGSPGQILHVSAFYSPSRNISCQILPDTLICGSVTPPQFVTMSTSGALTVCTGVTCAGDAGQYTAVLSYGDTTVSGPFKCLSATSGVTCTVAGKGFEISHSGVTKVP